YGVSLVGKVDLGFGSVGGGAHGGGCAGLGPRRELFRRSALLTLPAILRGTDAAGAADGLRAGADVYQSIGVRPLINARGTFTIISGALMLPEVRAAMDAAAQHHLHPHQLIAAVGTPLPQLAHAEIRIL